MTARWCGFLVFHLAAARVFAQAPASPETPVFRSAANLVEAAAVVRDGQGKAIGSLTVGDFQLFDSGAPHAISRFAVEQLERRAAADGSRGAQPNHFVAFVVDDQNLVPETFPPASLSAIHHLSRLQPGDRASVAATSGRMVLDFTNDRDKLRDALSRMGSLARRETFDVSKLNAEITCRITYLKADRILEGDPGSLRNCVPAPGQPQGIRAVRPPAAGLPVPGQSGEVHRIFLENQVRAHAESIVQAGDRDVRNYFAAMARLIAVMSRMPGERSIILLSPGMYVAPRFRNLQDRIIADAVRARVVISGVDPRGVYLRNDPNDPATWADTWGLAETSERFSFMENVTSGTGGTFIRGDNDIAGALNRLDSLPEFVYILGFSPALMKLDGKYHPLKITLRRPRGLTVEARRGYFAAGSESDTADAPQRQMRDVLFSDRQLRDLPVRLQMRSSHKPNADIVLTAIAHIDLRPVLFRKAEDGGNRSGLILAVGLFDRNGNCVQDLWKEIELRPSGEQLGSLRQAGIEVNLDFSITPGSYLVRLLVRDSGSLASGTDSAAVDIRP